LPNIKKEKSLLKLKEEEDTTANKKVLEDKRNPSSKRKPRLPRRSP
jgi:hypothetical protein